MAAAFPAPPGKFIGRDDYISRFQARAEHFPLFIYEGISGSGKTALVLRLARETKSLGLTKAVYLKLWPGETIHSILGRVEGRFRRAASGAERLGDPFARLIEILDTQKVCLVLDHFHDLRREDVPALARAIKLKRGKYTVIAACRGDPELSAMDRVQVHLERVGPLNKSEVLGIAGQFKLSPEALDRLAEDASRGGSSGHALTLTYMLSLCGDELPPDEFLKKQTARSVNAFKALMAEVGGRLGEEERQTLACLLEVGMPVSKTVATEAFGDVVERMVKDRLIDLIDGEIHVHSMVSDFVDPREAKLTPAAAKTIAKHFESQAATRGEPMLVARAGQILATAGAPEDAVEILASGWDSIRELGFMEAYLKTLATIDAPESLKPRLQLLSARARMRQGNPAWVKKEMEGLAAGTDKWTRIRALAALAYIHQNLHEYKQVVEAYDELRKLTAEVDFLVPAGVLAAGAMVRLGQVGEAEKLARALLGKIKGKKLPEREGELHRLLARVYAQSGRLDLAVKEGLAAAKAFEAAGDLYHAATAHGFVGDLYRETGDFELAREAFQKFKGLAHQWGDRDLTQIAELAEAWVSLDVGDLTHAAQQVADVERDMSAAPSRRLRRYLAAARALLDAGRGHHREAASQLLRVVDAWEAAGQRAIADILRAQLVRSLIACGDIDQAEAMVRKTLKRLDANTAAPRVATFLRESALIRLRRKDIATAMEELSQARKLFGKGGNRREEALTLHRIAHAALDEGDFALAEERAQDALKLARSIKHQRAAALAREVLGRAALYKGDSAEALKLLKEAAQSLRKLGDELGSLHVQEWLLRAQVFSGDLAAAQRLGPKVRTQAEKLGVDEVRHRATALSGVAMLRRDKMDAARRLFQPVDLNKYSPLTAAMMWRFGEALATVQNEPKLALERRDKWVKAVHMLPEHRQEAALGTLEQLELPPRERCRLRTDEGDRVVGTEYIGWLDPSPFSLFVDALYGRVFIKGEPTPIVSYQLGGLLTCLVRFAPEVATWDNIYRNVLRSEIPEKPDRGVNDLVRDLKKVLRKAKGLSIEIEETGVRMVPPKGSALLVPTFLASEDLSIRQMQMVRLLGQLGTAPLKILQEELDLTRASARREVGELMEAGLVEAVRDGRGQAFRLA